MTASNINLSFPSIKPHLLSYRTFMYNSNAGYKQQYFWKRKLMARPATDLLKMSPGRLLLRSNGLTPPTEMPTLIYGTAWKKDRSAELVYTALKAGFRAVDTAAQPKHYREDLVGDGVRKAIAEGIAKREELYVSTSDSFIV
jgi:hypothetical protein